MEFMYNDDVPFDSQKIETIQQGIVKSINSRLNQARSDGLLLLDRLLPCSKDILSKYGLFWITNATKVVENIHSSTQDLTLACKVLGSLIEDCKNIPELHKQISTRIVKQIINALSALRTNAKCGAVYYLIAVLLYHYPEVCERFQELIKKMILLQIDSTDDNLVNASAKCYVLFSKATERSFKSTKATPMYTRLIYNEMLLCNNLNAIMDQLFRELIELKKKNIKKDLLELPYITDREYNKQEQRFSNLCIYLSSMLRGYEARNSVLPQNILQVLSRGLMITPLNLKTKTSDEQMLYIILPKLHISLLTVLDALINGFAQELVPFGITILELFQTVLQWTNTDLKNQITFSNSKPFRSVKIQAYKCLCSWLMNTSSLSGIETIANECINSILKDIIPERDRILLTMHQKTPQLSKRAIKRFKQSQYENSTVLNNGKDSIKSGHLDPDLCREALITLYNILSSGTILLKETFYKNVLNTVIPLLYNLYLNSSEQNFYKENHKCRLELFKVLKALLMYPHITLAFPIQYCLEISHMAAYDIDINIIQEAKLALAELEKIIHPAAPTLQLPRQQEPDNEFVFESQAEEVASKSDKRSWIEEDISENVSESQAEEVAIISKSDKRSWIEEDISENVFESQAEVAITSKSDKRSWTEENLSENDVTLSVHKRPKIIASEIIQNGNNIKLIKKKSTLNIDKFQTEKNSYKNISKLNKNDKIEEELPKLKNSCKNISKLNKNDKIEKELPNDTDIASFICEQPKIVTSRCTEIIPSENTIESIEIVPSENIAKPIEIVPSKNTIKLIETNNSIMDIDKTQEDENLCEEEETGNILQEECEIHYNKEENQHNIDKIINSTTENKVECEYITHVNTEEKKQLKENLISYHTNEPDKKIEDIFLQKFSEFDEEIHMAMNEKSRTKSEEELVNAQDVQSLQEEINWQID